MSILPQGITQNLGVLEAPMDIISGLNERQRQAVEHGQGPALVLAGAGSGKTRVIACRIAHLIQNSAARPENILAVTFTNKAAKEMRERVQKLIGTSRSAEPLIATFHSFCVRLLRREIHHLGYKRDFSIYDTDDQKRLVKQALEELNLSEKDIKPRDVLGRISYAKNHGIAPENFSARFPSELAKDIEYIYEKYDSRLRNSNSLDFDDLLLKSVAVLEKNQSLQRYYGDWFKYILVDEYQDTNRPQYKLLRLLTTTHSNLFVVGDEDQSIYKFRGADIQNILKFEKDFPGARVIRLEQNYRSRGTILKAAAAVVANNTERKGKTLWTQNPDGEKVSCRRSQSPRDEAWMIAGHIRSILKENPDDNIAILYRANFLSRNFEDVLTQQGISYAVVGSVAFFGRAEIKDLIAYLRVIFNPADDAALLRIINTPTRGIGGATVDMLTAAALEKGISILETLREKIRDPQLAARTARALKRFMEFIDKWAEARDSLTPAELLTMILADIQYKEMLEKQGMSEETANRLANIDELIQAAAESEQRGETVAEFLDRASLSSELDHLDPAARVALMTLHSAKGLEFDTVFLVGMEEGLFPHSRASESNADLEEERRLCYVGITRARKKLFVTWTPFRKAYGPDAGFPAKISRFLREMPEELIDGSDEMEEDEELEPFTRKSGFTSHFSRRFHESPEKRRTNFPQTGSFTKTASSVKEKPRPREEPKSNSDTTSQPKSIAELKAYLEQKQKAAAAWRPPSAKESSGSGLRAGMRVRHEQFGDGIILSRERRGDDYRLTVTFSLVGKKTLMENFAKLKAL
jgi:DNA helicase-2/ATP-dependent DNA helicase PcrA